MDDDGESIRLTFGDLPDEVAAGSMKESTVHIEDDDARSVSVSFEQPTYSVAEGATTSVKVRLSDDPGRSVNIVLAKSPQGGIALDDYSGVPESITFRTWRKGAHLHVLCIRRPHRRRRRGAQAGVHLPSPGGRHSWYLRTDFRPHRR